MNTIKMCIASALVALPIWSSSFAVNSPNKAEEIKISSFDIKTNAEEQDWKYFFASKANWRFSLWSYQKNLGKSLKDWHWTWRIGWIKSCKKASDIKLEHCAEIISQGANDQALVVRSEVVNYLAEVYAGTEDQKIISQLKKSFEDKRNVRAGKPLYIQKQILYALKNVGGRRAVQTASNLATMHPETAAYYEKLEKVD
jgi:hypothetical protein